MSSAVWGRGGGVGYRAVPLLRVGDGGRAAWTIRKTHGPRARGLCLTMENQNRDGNGRPCPERRDSPTARPRAGWFARRGYRSRNSRAAMKPRKVPALSLIHISEPTRPY